MKMKSVLLLLASAILICGCSKELILDIDYGTFKDYRDHHTYEWVKIGEQIWMSENLAYILFVNSPGEGARDLRSKALISYLFAD